MLPDLFSVSREEAERQLRLAMPIPVKYKGGYADVPGSGPAGETCKTCAHLYRHEMAKTYLKCALMKHRWTGGPGSDIKAKSPACARWEAINQTTNQSGENHE